MDTDFRGDILRPLDQYNCFNKNLVFNKLFFFFLYGVAVYPFLDCVASDTVVPTFEAYAMS